MILTAKTWNKTKENVESAEQCRALCLRLINRRSYSEYELRKKLEERNACYEHIEQTVSILKENALINDAALASAIIHYYGAVCAKGRFAVRNELCRRGIKEEVFAPLLAEEYDEEEERKAALLYLQKQLGRSRKEENESVAKDKLYASLRRRGFSSSAIEFAFFEVVNNK